MKQESVGPCPAGDLAGRDYGDSELVKSMRANLHGAEGRVMAGGRFAERIDAPGRRLGVAYLTGHFGRLSLDGGMRIRQLLLTPASYPARSTCFSWPFRPSTYS